MGATGKMDNTWVAAARQAMNGEASGLSPRRVALATLVATAVVLSFYIIIRFHNVVIILLAAVMLSVAMEPLIRRFERRGVPPAAGVVLIYVIFIAVFGALIWLAAPLVVDQSALLTRRFSESYSTIRTELVTGNNLVVSRLARHLPRLSPLLRTSPTEEEILAGFTSLINATRIGFDIMLGIVATLLLALYWTLESRRIKRAFLLLLPSRHRDDARDLIAAIEGRIGNYVVGQGLLCLVIGVISFIAYLLIGLPNALTLAVFAGLMEAVPLVGPLVGAVPAIAIALTISPTTALWVVVATIIIQQLENNLLVPRVMSRALGVSPLITLLAMLGAGSLFGIPGVLIALPLASTVQMLVERFVLQRSASEESTGRGKASVLRYRTHDLVKDIRSQIRKKPELATAVSEQIEDSLEAIALDLDSLLAQQAPEEGRSS